MVHLYTASSAEPLAERLATLLVDDPLPPMESEWFAVPTAGLRRWLSLELARHLGASGSSRGDGVVANIRPVLPGALLEEVIRAGAGTEPGAADPWEVDRLVWRLLEVMEERAGDEVLREFLTLPAGGSHYSRARRVADLFDRYHRRRPDMVRSWRADGPDFDGAGVEVEEWAAWQPELWRRVRGLIDRPSPPERLGGLLERLRAGEVTLDLPRRLVFFGFTSLPGLEFAELISAVGTAREVHVFLLEPCAFDVGSMLDSAPTPADGAPRMRASDTTGSMVRLPLLRSWGRVARESALLVADAHVAGLGSPERLPARSRSGPPSTLLARLQQAIREDAVPVAVPADPSDRSIAFHACFGPMRQVQVARDAILHLLADEGAGLTEEDVLVLCPKLESYAPLVEAAFGGGGAAVGDSPPADHPVLRFRVADRSIRSVNPVLGAAAALLELAAGRCEAPAVLDFIALDPVRTRFGFDDEALATIARWVDATTVRWGLDPAHRDTFGVSAEVVGFSWQSALDRLFVGSTVEDGSLELAVGGTAPVGLDAGSSDVLGRFARCIGLIGGLVRCIGVRQDLAAWVTLLRDTFGPLFEAPAGAGWQTDALAHVFTTILDEGSTDGMPSAVQLGYTDIRRLVARLLDDTPGRPDFFRGGVTVSSTAPLRWVPFRVVCILGMDQDAFSVTPAAAEDLIAAAPQFGDPDRRADDRQRLLEAVLAAGDHLLVVRDGHDVRTNQEVKRSVPAAELFESVLSLVPAEERPATAARLETTHPRHPFDPPALLPGHPLADGPWTFDPADRAAAVARAGRAAEAERIPRHPLPDPGITVIELDELRSFLRKPVPFFFRKVLGARLPGAVEHSPVELPVELGTLETWAVGMRRLEAALDGVDLATWLAFERASSTLPPAGLADGAIATIDEVVADMTVLLARLGVRRQAYDEVAVDIPLASGVRIVGTVPLRLGPPTPGPARYTYSTSRPVHRLEAWLDLMVLQATDPETAWRSVAVGRKTTKFKAGAFDLVSAHDVGTREAAALAALEVAADLFVRGAREPLPLFPSVSSDLHAGKDPTANWKRFRMPGDGDDEYVVLAFGGIDLRSMLGIPARPGDPDGSGGRAERYARYLWSTVDATSTGYVEPPADDDGTVDPSEPRGPGGAR